MRNVEFTRIVAVFSAVALLVGGCASDAKSRTDLSSGFEALDAKQYDAAVSAADKQLARAPGGAGSAEAFYLRGRALEQRPAASRDQARANWQAARKAYLEALQSNPSSNLESYIRTSLANVAYFSDDYPAALREWQMAYPKLNEPSIQSWVLYRMGLCQQRLGQFEQADTTFAQVQKKFPNTVPAQRARDYQGKRGFTVQLATYANPATARSAVEILKREGVVPSPVSDPAGRTVVRVGPLPNYQQAVALKQRYADRYPDALIVP